MTDIEKYAEPCVTVPPGQLPSRGCPVHMHEKRSCNNEVAANLDSPLPAFLHPSQQLVLVWLLLRQSRLLAEHPCQLFSFEPATWTEHLGNA